MIFDAGLSRWVSDLSDWIPPDWDAVLVWASATPEGVWLVYGFLSSIPPGGVELPTCGAVGFSLIVWFSC